MQPNVVHRVFFKTPLSDRRKVVFLIILRVLNSWFIRALGRCCANYLNGRAVQIK